MLDFRNYFRLFSIEQSFSIDHSLLEKNYLNLQKQYHPDRATDQDERKRFCSVSAHLNRAYLVLKVDVDRATYILSMRKINIDSYQSDRLARIVRGVFDENESLDNIAYKEDLQKFLIEKNRQKESLLSQMKEVFKVGDMEEFALNTISLKYICKMMSVAETRLSSM